MNLKPFIVCATVFLTACEGNLEEVCYYKVSIEAGIYRSQGGGLGPYGVLADDLWERSTSGDLPVPHQIYDGDTIFGDHCDVEVIQSYVANFFENSEFEYEFSLITEEDYIEFHKRFVTKKK